MAIPLPKSRVLKDNPNKVTHMDKTGELSEDEYTFILDDVLPKRYREDPIVIKFIDSFIRCHNIAQASEECGIKASLGYRIRHYKSVALVMQKLVDRSAIKYGFDNSEVMERTKEIMDFDPISIQNPDGTYKSNLYDIEPAARRSIKKLKVKNLYSNVEDINGIKSKIIVGEIIEYEFYDKMKAIDLAGKEKDMFKTTTKVEHTVSKDMASILLESVKRGNDATRTLAQADVIEVKG